MDDKEAPSPPSRTTAEYEADKAAGIVRGGYPLFKEDFVQRRREWEEAGKP